MILGTRRYQLAAGTHCLPAGKLPTDAVVHGGDLETPIGVTPATLLAPTDRAPALPDEQTLVERSASRAASYYLYTSGTTGKPKCVVLQQPRHRQRRPPDPAALWSPPTTSSFPSRRRTMTCRCSICSVRCAGARWLPAPHQEKDAISWNQLVEKHRVTLWCSVPAILEMLLTCKRPTACVRCASVAQGGDTSPATVQTLRTLRPDLALFRSAGQPKPPSEHLDRALQENGTVPYGRPLPANRYFICHDATARPAWSAASIPPGSTRRWATRAGELKQHDFVTLEGPDGQPLRAFRTGDQGYYRADGNIVRHPGERLCEDPRRARLAAGNRRRAAPSGDPAHGGGGLPQRRTTRRRSVPLYLTRDGTPCRCPRSAPSPPAICPVPIFDTLIIECAAAVRQRQTDRHRIRADLSHQQTARALNACAAPPPNAPLRAAAEILTIYWQAIGVAPRPEWGEETAFIAMAEAAYQTGGGTPQRFLAPVW